MTNLPSRLPSSIVLLFTTTTTTTNLLFLFLLCATTSSDGAAPTISFTPKALKKFGDSVEIRWSNVASPSKLNWLGIYSPPNSSSDHFIGYLFLSSSPTWQNGHSSLSFPLINLRSSYQFRIFRWTKSEINPKKIDHDHNPLPGTAHLLAQSEELRFENPHGPEHIHLAFTDKEDEIRVMFLTSDGRESFVKYGEEEEEMEEDGNNDGGSI